MRQKTHTGKFPAKSLNAHQVACPKRPSGGGSGGGGSGRPKSQVVQASSQHAPVKQTPSRVAAGKRDYTSSTKITIVPLTQPQQQQQQQH
jgi:hypothetical protein